MNHPAKISFLKSGNMVLASFKWGMNRMDHKCPKFPLNVEEFLRNIKNNHSVPHFNLIKNRSLWPVGLFC